MMMTFKNCNVEQQECFVKEFINTKKKKTQLIVFKLQWEHITQFFALQQRMNCISTKTSLYDVTCLKLNLNFNRSICSQFLKKESFEDEVNNESAKLNQQILVLYLWQIIDMIWIIIMKFSVFKDNLIVDDMKLEKMITVLTFVVLMIKLRVRNDLSDFHKLILIAIFLIAMKVWKVEIQQYFLKLMI